MAMSAEARARILFAAAVLFAALAAAGWALFAARQHVMYEIRSREAVSGLIPGAPVEFHGVEVGQVREVRLAGARDVRIFVALRRDAPVTSATRATVTGRGLAARGFTGYVYVSLEDEGEPGAALEAAAGEPYPRIAAAPGRSINLDTTVTQLNDSLQAVTSLLQTTLNPQTVDSLQRSLASLDQVTRTLAANSARMERVIANAEQASRQLPPLLRSGQAAMHALQTEVVPQANGAMQGLSELSASANDTVRALQYQILPETYRTLTRLDHLTVSLDETATRIRRNPAVLLRGTAPGTPGPGEAQ